MKWITTWLLAPLAWSKKRLPFIPSFLQSNVQYMQRLYFILFFALAPFLSVCLRKLGHLSSWAVRIILANSIGMIYTHTTTSNSIRVIYTHTTASDWSTQQTTNNSIRLIYTTNNKQQHKTDLHNKQQTTASEWSTQQATTTNNRMI